MISHFLAGFGSGAVIAVGVIFVIRVARAARFLPGGDDE